MKTFFTADPHFYHSNILVYCKRPFKDSVEMNEAIITNWNNKVGKTDLVYLLGDVIFGGKDENRANILFNGIMDRLNGSIILIKGNHDKVAWKNRGRFYASYDTYYEIKINNQDIILNHYAQITWNKKHHGAWLLCGHSHYSLPETRKDGIKIGKILDVGLDGNNFTPYSFEEIQKIMEAKPLITSIKELNDHHE